MLDRWHSTGCGTCLGHEKGRAKKGHCRAGQGSEGQDDSQWGRGTERGKQSRTAVSGAEGLKEEDRKEQVPPVQVLCHSMGLQHHMSQLHLTS